MIYAVLCIRLLVVTHVCEFVVAGWTIEHTLRYFVGVRICSCPRKSGNIQYPSTYPSVYLYVNICSYLYPRPYIYDHFCLNPSVCMCVCVFVCVHIITNHAHKIEAYMCVCVCVGVCTCMCACILMNVTGEKQWLNIDYPYGVIGTEIWTTLHTIYETRQAKQYLTFPCWFAFSKSYR